MRIDVHADREPADAHYPLCPYDTWADQVLPGPNTPATASSAARPASLPLLAALSGQWHAAVNTGHGREDISAARLALGGDQ
jgi:hypothetical protein